VYAVTLSAGGYLLKSEKNKETERGQSRTENNTRLKSVLMKSTLSSLGHKFLALDKCLNHLAHLLESAQNNLVALDKAITLVLDCGLVAEFADRWWIAWN
jgi:hypothetical protein